MKHYDQSELGRKVFLITGTWSQEFREPLNMWALYGSQGLYKGNKCSYPLSQPSKPSSFHVSLSVAAFN